MVKTSHSKFPKKWLETTMKDWPPGLHLVLEATCKGVEVIACRYKYNKRKVCCFVFTKGAGHTEEGKPYVAKWKDVNNNTRTRNVPRPDVISNYFGSSNVVDLFNQSRQFDLKLEKHWVTEDGYFRLVTSLFGIVVTDCWKSYLWHLAPQHRHQGIEIVEFARLLTKDMFGNEFSDEKTLQDRVLTIMDSNASSVPPIVSTLTRSETDVLTTLSTLSQSIHQQTQSKVAPPDLHPLIMCTDEVGHEVKSIGGTRVGMRRKRGKCSECGKNTRYYCFTCPPTGQRKHEWCCPDDTSANKRMCHTQHKENRETAA